MRILLVEDDELIGDGIQSGMSRDGHAVDWLKDGQTAFEALKTETFDIVVLDLGLPRMSGLDLLRGIRNRGLKVPVLILTARDTVEDRIMGLDNGADDYLTKPFDLHELYARCRALQRRSTDTVSTTELVYKHIVIDPASHTVTINGEPARLPRREFALLHKLIQNAGRVMSREQLAQTLYGWGEDIDSNALEVHIHNLRKKVGPGIIRTIRGIGYIVEKIE